MNTTTLQTTTSSPSRLGRLAVLVYGFTMYFTGVAGLMAIVLVTLGVLPITGGPVELVGTGPKIALCVALVALFGIQHAIMAREGFKKRWTQIIPPAAERATFTGIAGILMGLAMWLWQPMPTILWDVGEGPQRIALLALCGLGWGYLLAASWAIDHFELFGVKQVVRNMRGLETPEPSFQERWMYRFDRHPLMTGVLFGLWSAPTMTVDRLVMALAFTTFIVLGVSIEERDLRRKHGAAYAEYAKRVHTWIPRIPLR